MHIYWPQPNDCSFCVSPSTSFSTFDGWFLCWYEASKSSWISIWKVHWGRKENSLHLASPIPSLCKDLLCKLIHFTNMTFEMSHKILHCTLFTENCRLWDFNSSPLDRRHRFCLLCVTWSALLICHHVARIKRALSLYIFIRHFLLFCQKSQLSYS